jgi:hypothetical protein
MAGLLSAQHGTGASTRVMRLLPRFTQKILAIIRGKRASRVRFVRAGHSSPAWVRPVSCEEVFLGTEVLGEENRPIAQQQHRVGSSLPLLAFPTGSGFVGPCALPR